MTTRSWARIAVTALCSGALAAATAGGIAIPASATGGAGGKAPPAPQTQQLSDDLPNPLGGKQSALRGEAIADVLTGKKQPVTIDGSTVVRMGTEPAAPPRPAKRMFTHPQTTDVHDVQVTVGKRGQHGPQVGQGPRGDRPGQQGTERSGHQQDQYVELSREKTDNVFVILAQFGDKRDPRYPDQDSDPDTPGPYEFDGPRQGQIPQPDRSVNNTSLWKPNYDKGHYRQLYFDSSKGVNSLANYYEKQSSGRYSVDGEVAGWVTVPYNEARYGRNVSFDAEGNVVCQSIVCPNVWHMIEDGLDAWVVKQKSKGMTSQQIADSLKKFDQWDRYDYDGDGDFNESDGYLDHFQILHAGAGEAAGAPVYGEDAVWSHSWYVNGTDIGVTGPHQLGGYQIGDTGYWVGNYLTEPENAGLGVLAHEYGHDLGLPDEYDTTYTGESSAAFWTLMSSGSYMSLPQDEGIGGRANDLNAWDKLQLGWLDYEIATPGKQRRYVLGPAEYHSRRAQGLVVVLPDKQVSTEYGPPYAGDHMWWSTMGNAMTTTMAHELDLTGTSSAAVTLKARYDIEEGYDYLYAEASTDGGGSWSALDGTVDGEPFATDGGGRPALTGSTGGQWVDVAIPMDDLAGQDVMFRFRYTTDAAVAGNGFFADQITATADGQTILSDGAENGTDDWTTDGFTITTGTESNAYDNFYVIGNKNYVSYDKTLKYGPYNFGWLPDKPNLVEHFPYQDGVLISYWDTTYTDNNVGVHPGHGQILPIDAHPRPDYNMEGQPWRTRIQVYDATFGTQRADSLHLHVNGKASYVRGGNATRTFNDDRKYWYASKPDAGVKVPGTGTKLRVVRERGTSVVLRVRAPAIG